VAERKTKKNPERGFKGNHLASVLPAGISEESFRAGVAASGYPLQIVVGAALDERGYALEEEWAFGDPDSGERRAIDIVALRAHQTEPVLSEHGTTEFAQALLIECKQSRHPYVFFESVAPPELVGFPVLLGIGSAQVGGRGGGGSVPIGSALSVQDEPLMKVPPIAASLSRAEANGKKVMISGEHSYKSLLMPLTKALANYERQFRGSRPDGYGSSNRVFQVRLAQPLAVIDAPMIFVGRPSEEEPHLEQIEWVRLIVRHPVTWSKWTHGVMQGGGGFTVVDVVHRSFLNTFLDKYWARFGDQFFGRFAPMNDEILSNKLNLGD
jgi:hypothetical protein